MISQEDYNFIVAFDAVNGKAKDQFLEEQRTQCPKTFLNLMGHVSKDQTIYYILVLVDEMLIVCIFNHYCILFYNILGLE
jgi:V-type H+-transporting ATPase subunit H